MHLFVEWILNFLGRNNTSLPSSQYFLMQIQCFYVQSNHGLEKFYKALFLHLTSLQL